MPKAVLEFNLPEEQEEFELCQKAVDYSIVLHHFYYDSLRKRTKYLSDNLSEDQLKLLEELKDEFFQLLNEYNLEL